MVEEDKNALLFMLGPRSMPAVSFRHRANVKSCEIDKDRFKVVANDGSTLIVYFNDYKTIKDMVTKHGALRDYQEDGYSWSGWLFDKWGAFWDDDMEILKNARCEIQDIVYVN